jgi:predicted Abi (CAAX) family protease
MKGWLMRYRQTGTLEEAQALEETLLNEIDDIRTALAASQEAVMWLAAPESEALRRIAALADSYLAMQRRAEAAEGDWQAERERCKGLEGERDELRDIAGGLKLSLDSTVTAWDKALRATWDLKAQLAAERDTLRVFLTGNDYGNHEALCHVDGDASCTCYLAPLWDAYRSPRTAAGGKGEG